MRCTVAVIALLALLAAPLLAAEPPDAKDPRKQLRDIQMKLLRARMKAYRENADLKKMSDQIAQARKNLEAAKLAIPEYKKLSDEAAELSKKGDELRGKIRKLDATARDVAAKSEVGKEFAHRRDDLQKQIDEALLKIDEIKQLTEELKAAADAGTQARSLRGKTLAALVKAYRENDELKKIGAELDTLRKKADQTARAIPEWQECEKDIKALQKQIDDHRKKQQEIVKNNADVTAIKAKETALSEERKQKVKELPEIKALNEKLAELQKKASARYEVARKLDAARRKALKSPEFKKFDDQSKAIDKEFAVRAAEIPEYKDAKDQADALKKEADALRKQAVERFRKRQGIARSNESVKKASAEVRDLYSVRTKAVEQLPEIKVLLDKRAELNKALRALKPKKAPRTKGKE